MIWNVLIFKISITTCLLIPAWVPETSLVDAPQVAADGHEKHLRMLDEAATATTEHTEAGKTIVDPEWLLNYRKYALYAFIAGALMCIVSRLTHILAKPGAL